MLIKSNIQSYLCKFLPSYCFIDFSILFEYRVKPLEPYFQARLMVVEIFGLYLPF